MKKSSHKPTEISVYAQAEVPLSHGKFLFTVFHNNQDDKEHIALTQGDLSHTQGESVFVRIHSECLTGEIFSSLKCDCKAQLESALTLIASEQKGMLIYLRQEGRGIGLGNKIKAYGLQNQGLDTVKSNQALGFASDLREFEIAALILKHFKISKIRLHTNNPQKAQSMQQEGIEVTHIIPALSGVTDYNKDYLETKFHQLGHKLEKLFKS